MSSTTVTSTTTVPPPAPAKPRSSHKSRDLLAAADIVKDTWYQDLVRDGYCVVKGAIPQERALQYANEMFDWLEGFNLGFDRNDPSTINEKHLPIINEKGMCLNYAATHEDWAWKIRSEPGVIDAFEKVYQDKDLIVSFDAVNLTFPNRTDIPANKPWPHQDQDPEKPGFRCLQGLVNLLPNGPKDGGLIVCKGAYHLSKEYHDHFRSEERIPAWTPEWYGFKETGMQWFKEKGFEWVKVEVSKATYPSEKSPTNPLRPTPVTSCSGTRDAPTTTSRQSRTNHASRCTPATCPSPTPRKKT